MKLCPECGSKISLVEILINFLFEDRKVICCKCNSSFSAKVNKDYKNIFIVISLAIIFLSNLLSINVVNRLQNIILAHTICMSLSLILILLVFVCIERKISYEVVRESNMVNNI